MPRGRKKRVITPEKIEKSADVKKEIKEAVLFDKDKILKQAKEAGLFKHNKMYGKWEIIISAEEYEKI